MEKFPHLFLPDHLTTTVNLADLSCDCETADGPWSLELDEGSILLSHDVCGKPIPHDQYELVQLSQPMKVRLIPDKERCSCVLGSCDCTTYFILEAIK